MEKSKKNIFLATSLIVVFLLVVISLITFEFDRRQKEELVAESNVQPEINEPVANNPTPPPAPVSPIIISPPVNAQTEYKNGVYAALGDYISPGGAEQVGVKLTLQNDVIKDAEVEVKATRPMTQKFQGIFSENYKQYVVGKNIDEVVLDKVSGSSLTPKGFNDALEKIKMEAKV